MFDCCSARRKFFFAFSKNPGEWSPFSFLVMVFFVGASSLYHALEKQPENTKKRLEKFVFAKPKLSLNPHALDIKDTLQYYLNHWFPRKKGLIIWHDVINNTITPHRSNDNKPLSPRELCCILENYQNKFKALVYCPREGAEDIFGSLKNQNIPVVHVLKDLVSKRKQKDLSLRKDYLKLHQKPFLELKSLTIVHKHCDNLQKLISKSRPKRLNPRRRKALLKKQNEKS